MAAQKSFFLTGANAKIVLNNTTVAFATDISYRIIVRHGSPRVLGRYEVEAHIPLSYDVEGSLTIIKYGRGMQSFMGASAPKDADNLGSGIGSYTTQSALGALGGALGLPSAEGQFDGGAQDNFVPSRLFQSKMFNIEIKQKVPNVKSLSGNGFAPLPPKQGQGKDIPSGTALGKILKKGGETVNSLLNTSPGDEVPMVVLRDCRFTDLDFKLSKKGAATITMRFKARYADDDTFIAAKSGVGQELS